MLLSRKALLFHVFLMLMSSTMFAQSHIVHGVVNAFDSIPLIGAEVFIKSTKQSVYTDTAGVFVAPCNEKDKLKISASGFSNQNVTISKKIKVVAVNLKLKSAKKIKNEEIRAYAIGYGYVTDRDKTTATESLRKNEASFSRYPTMYDLLTGQFPGVEVTRGEVIIRGTNSLNSSSAALIVVDGVIMESSILNTLRPVEIKDVHVIKDGSAAVYGSRGANGVVLIETLRGGDNIR